MKKLVATFVALMASLALVASAQASNESAVVKTTATPRSGSFYQSYPVPANLVIDAQVNVPAGTPTILPLKKSKVTFPSQVSFHLNPKMPVCTESKLNEQSALGSPSEILADCKQSVVGTGTATLNLFKNTSAPLDDPILIMFNAGTSSSGNAKIKIYGFSKGTGVGILMRGEVKGGVLSVAVPVLSYDSATSVYQFNLPGDGKDTALNRPEIGVVAKGLDPNYVKATCPSSGKLVTNGVLTLGERDPATGADTGPETDVKSPTETQSCTGMAGKAKLSGKAKGPSKVKNGAKGTFKVTIKNNGTAVAKSVKVTAAGGKASAGNIPAKGSTTVKVKAKVKGKKGKKVTVKFTIKGKGVSAKATAKVKVK